MPLSFRDFFLTTLLLLVLCSTSISYPHRLDKLPSLLQVSRKSGIPSLMNQRNVQQGERAHDHADVGPSQSQAQRFQLIAMAHFYEFFVIWILFLDPTL